MTDLIFINFFNFSKPTEYYEIRNYEKRNVLGNKSFYNFQRTASRKRIHENENEKEAEMMRDRCQAPASSSLERD